MDTRPKLFRYIILIPHRDALKPLEEYRQKLFTTGIAGAHAFPLAAPLVEVSRPFNREELTELARNIRNSTKETDGKITSGCIAPAGYPGKFPFFGPQLSFLLKESIFPSTTRPKILYTISPPVLCASLMDPKTIHGGTLSFEEAPVLSFRAASLANLAIRPIADEEYSFEWKISPPVWLPNLHARHYGKLYSYFR